MCDGEVMQSGSQRQVRVVSKTTKYWSVLNDGELKDDLSRLPKKRGQRTFMGPTCSVFECTIGDVTVRALSRDLLRDKISRVLNCAMISHKEVKSSKGDLVQIDDDHGLAWMYGFFDGSYRTPTSQIVVIQNGCVCNDVAFDA